MGKRLVIKGADFSINGIEHSAEVEYTLQNGYASVTSPSGIEIDGNSSSNLIRVRTSQIFGSYRIKLKTGYVIRAIAAYATSIDPITAGTNSTTNAENLGSVQGLSQYDFTETEKYSIVTICKTDSNQQISASEDIVDYIERL